MFNTMFIVLNTYGVSIALSIVFLSLLVYGIFIEKIDEEKTVSEIGYRDQETKLNNQAIRITVLWTVLISIAAFCEATPNLMEYFIKIGHENAKMATIACNLVFILVFVIMADIVSMVTIDLRLRALRTKILNRGKK